ncbi:MAG TPA: methyltransferase domain-containing protein [Urbifossiella sp.]|nr:methyltransferase domain-containing protein [Urbifossiella sp.]
MPKPCQARHPNPVTGCRVCWLAAHARDYQRLWGLPETGEHATATEPEPRRTCPPGRRPLPCVYEGAVLAPDHSDDGAEAENRHVRACRVHSRCTRSLTTGAARACEDCAEYTPALAPEPAVRHLLYHVYPRREGDWRTRVLRLRERIKMFNGRRVVAVAHDGTTEHPNLVEDALKGTGCEVIAVPNDPNRREVATFLPLFARVAADAAPGHATLYGHAKGVTRPETSTAARWAAALEEVHLDHWPAVADRLRRFPIVGAFQKRGAGWMPEESLSDWHFSGSWFWVRNADLFARDWTRIDRFWGGIESYPSLHFAPHEAANLVCGGAVPDVNLYDHAFWERAVEPALAAFRAANAVREPAGPAAAPRWLNFGCGPHYAPGWLNVDVVETQTIRPDVVVPARGPLPFQAGAFDRCYMSHVLEHVPWDDVPQVLAEVRRVVRPGGEVLVVGPDFARALERLRAEPHSADAVRQVWEVTEDDSHYQRNEPTFDWPGARHYWNCYEERVHRSLVRAGFAEVRALPVEPKPPLTDWPVVCYATNQCAVHGRVPS